MNNTIVYNIRLHGENGELFYCEDCGGITYRQVTDIEQGAMGFEVYECGGCLANYRCVTIGEHKDMTAEIGARR